MGFFLFTRTRRWIQCLGITVLSGVLIVLCGPVSYELNPQGGYLIAVAAQIPLIPAIAIQSSVNAGLGERERYAVRSTRKLRLLHLITLASASLLLLGIASRWLEAPESIMSNGYADLGPLAIGRNLIALLGAALIGASIFGQAFGWIIPLAWAILPFLVLPDPRDDDLGLLTLIMQGEEAFLPLIFAMGICALGVLLAINNVGSRRS